MTDSGRLPDSAENDELPVGRMGWAIFCRDCWKLRLKYKPSRIVRYLRRHG